MSALAMSEDAFDVLFESLRMIQKGIAAGGSGVNDICCKYWFEHGDESILEHLSESSPLTSDIARALLSNTRRLRSLSFLLQILADSVDKTYQSLSTRGREFMFAHGIKALPDEVLAYVMELTFDPDRKGREHITLSHVSRRFRDVALRHQKLWSRISGEMSPQWVNFQLARSGESKLFIDFNSGHCNNLVYDPSRDVTNCRCAYVLPILVKHCHRWYSFAWTHQEYSLLDPQINTANGTKYVTDILRDLHLPSLRHLTVFSNASAQEIGRLKSSVCNTWNMPNLRSLITGRGVGNLQLSSEITSLSLYTGEVESNAAPRIFTFLASPTFSRVERLTLDIDVHRPCKETGTAYNIGATVVPHRTQLDTLRSVSFEYHDSLRSRAFLRRLSELLVTPSLKHLEMHIHSRSDIVTVLDALRPWLEKVATSRVLERILFVFQDACFSSSETDYTVEQFQSFISTTCSAPLSQHSHPKIGLQFITSRSRFLAPAAPRITCYEYDWEKNAAVIQ